MITDSATIVDDGGAPDGEAQAELVALTEVEEVAKEMGWRPKTEFDGPDDKWKPARDFIKSDRGRRDMRNELKELRSTVDRMATASTRQTERALKDQAAEIEGRFAEAVAAKDTAGAAAAAKDMRELEAEATRTTATTGDVEADFARDNPWYGKDDEATAYAVSVCQREAAKGRNVPDQLAAVSVAMKKRFPEIVGEGGESVERKAAPSVAAPSRAPGVKRDRTYGDLPPAAKKAADDYAELFATRHGKDRDATKKAYAKDYFANASDAA